MTNFLNGFKTSCYKNGCTPYNLCDDCRRKQPTFGSINNSLTGCGVCEPNIPTSNCGCNNCDSCGCDGHCDHEIPYEHCHEPLHHQHHCPTPEFICVAGKDGKDGADGINGVDGKDGKDGVDGINGVNGKDGKDGADGINGVDGKDGKDGADGATGARGDQGLRGLRGADGLKGDKGDTGATGEKGERGDQGLQGIQGLKGDIGLTGATGAQGIQGVKGDQGLQGVKGDTGETGATGDKGERGDQGLQGIQGLKGDIGLTGATGAQGIQGVKGDQGLQGVKGDTGLQGIQGLQGVKGDTGLTGAKGDKGDTGLQGIQGLQGVKGDTGLTGATGAQGPTGPKGDPGCSCGVPGPTGAQGPAGATGATGAQGVEGKSGAGVCPCEIIFGKSIDFLLENEFEFEATVNAPFDLTLSSTEADPAEIYNTWSVEFADETLVPLCKLEALYLTFTTEQEKNTFVSLFSAVLNQTLSCCHNCGTCDICAEQLAVDQYNSIINMPANCGYEYYLSSECSCATSSCQTVAKIIDLCNFTNSTGEKLRGIIERKQLEKNITLIGTQKEELIGGTITKTIEATGLSSVLVSYEEGGEFKVALVCLEDVTVLQFEDIV